MTAGGIIIMVAQFLLSLSLLIILHEWGHYYPAKLFKTKVEKFYLFFDAFGKSLFKKKIGETEYGIGWLPLGGYVKIAGMIDESMDKEQMKQEPQPWEFRSKKPWQRLVIMLGGVTVNFVLAYIILVGMMFVYGEKFIPNSELKEGVVVSEFLQEKIGLKTGDKIISIGGELVKDAGKINKSILLGEGTVVVDRFGERVELDIPVDISGQTAKNDPKSFVTIPLPVIVSKIPDSSINAKSGVNKNWIFKSINNTSITTANFKKTLERLSGQNVEATLYNVKGEEKSYKVDINSEGKIEMVVSTTNKLDELDKIGFYDVSIKEYSFIQSFGAAKNKFVETIIDMITNVKLLVTSYKTGAARGMGSFISIAKIFSPTWDWFKFWDRTVMLSIMLGVLNLLPIPALDGGHAMFTLYEMITKRKPSEKFLEYAQMVGFVIMMIIFVYAFGNDIYRHFIK
ncbi:RIP metalloprotease RseP [Pseudofulvibacter geojedonensis]|uniref:Zinc metalloprotease n=1 Tax=Pseudofulvibacter geojedonensis TaxID=1123758 RepID=A0ABW3I433_9FLAO